MPNVLAQSPRRLVRYVLIMAAPAFLIACQNQDRPLHGQALVDSCVECHGSQGGAAIEGWPPIATMTEAEITAKLMGHRAQVIGDSTMAKVAHDLTDEQIEEIARFYGRD